MKFIFLSLCIFRCVFGVAQTTTAFYDYKWRPCEPSLASYYSIVTKTDSGWLRQDYFVSNRQLQMQALYSDEECKIKNGTALYYYANGQLQATGRFMYDKEDGIYISYYSNGMMSDSGFYVNGKLTGTRYRWYRNGYLADSITQINDSIKVHVSWFEDGLISAAGFLWHDKPHGK